MNPPRTLSTPDQLDAVMRSATFTYPIAKTDLHTAWCTWVAEARDTHGRAFPPGNLSAVVPPHLVIWAQTETLARRDAELRDLRKRCDTAEREVTEIRAAAHRLVAAGAQAVALLVSPPCPAAELELSTPSLFDPPEDP